MSINKNNKNFQITLDPECSEILETLAKRFNTTKSIIIKNALKVYASKKDHFINISYKTQWSKNDLQRDATTKSKKENNNDPEWDNIINDLEQITPPSSGHND